MKYSSCFTIISAFCADMLNAESGPFWKFENPERFVRWGTEAIRQIEKEGYRKMLNILFALFFLYYDSLLMTHIS